VNRNSASRWFGELK